MIDAKHLQRLEQEGDMSTTAKTVILAAIVLMAGWVVVWLVASTLS